MKRKDIDMLHAPLAGNILLYAIPVILTSYLQLLFNAADLIVVGRYCGSVSVAAVGATTALTYLFLNLMTGLSVGAGVEVAHAIGAGDPENVSRSVHTAMLTAIVGGGVLSVIGVTCAPYLLELMSTPESVLELASVYMRIFFAGVIFNLVYNFSTSILRAVGDTQSPLMILTGAGIINVILNVLFVTVLELNVAGVALATTISQALSAIAVVSILMRRTDSVRFHPTLMRFHGPQLAEIIRIGLPAGIQSSMFSISNVMIQSSINSFGDIMVSGNAAVSNIEGFCFSTVNGFHQTALNYIGQNMGAQQYGRVKKITALCMFYVTIAGCMIGGLSYLFRQQILGIYITDSPAAIEAGCLRMMFTTLPYVMYGWLDTITGCIRGLGASFLSMLLSILGICGIRLAWILWVFSIPQFRTPIHLYLSYPISWIITLTAQAIAFIVVFRKLTRNSRRQTTCL